MNTKNQDVIRRELFRLFLRLLVIAGGLWILINGGLDILTPFIMLAVGIFGLWEEEKREWSEVYKKED